MQSRTMSLIESVVNVIIGYGVAMATQIVAFPWFGLHPTMQENLSIALIFTIVSLTRSYFLRRLFANPPIYLTRVNYNNKNSFLSG